MHLNDDLIERVEDAVGGQSAVFLRDGGHFIVANDHATVVELIRDEKVALLRRALHAPDPSTDGQLSESVAASPPRLSQVQG
jgi:uncharacterized protein YlzI (FlbEa/FlbD family)